MVLRFVCAFSLPWGLRLALSRLRVLRVLDVRGAWSAACFEVEEGALLSVGNLRFGDLVGQSSINR